VEKSGLAALLHADFSTRLWLARNDILKSFQQSSRKTESVFREGCQKSLAETAGPEIVGAMCPRMFLSGVTWGWFVEVEGQLINERLPNMNAVLLNGVCKSFGEVRAVSDLSVKVPAGSIYGFLGPNGAGKTTTIRMIMNIIRPDSGSIEIFGEHLVERAKTRIGYMPEERGLYRKMTVRKVLAYFGEIKGVTGNDLARRVSGWNALTWLTGLTRKWRSFRGECIRNCNLQSP
jgi:ABC-type glutathione transport system ATPase component